jgi:hypothetical protein
MQLAVLKTEFMCEIKRSKCGAEGGVNSPGLSGEVRAPDLVCQGCRSVSCRLSAKEPHHSKQMCREIVILGHCWADCSRQRV